MQSLLNTEEHSEYLSRWGEPIENLTDTTDHTLHACRVMEAGRIHKKIIDASEFEALKHRVAKLEEAKLATVDKDNGGGDPIPNASPPIAFSRTQLTTTSHNNVVVNSTPAPTPAPPTYEIFEDGFVRVSGLARVLFGTTCTKFKIGQFTKAYYARYGLLTPYNTIATSQKNLETSVRGFIGELSPSSMQHYWRYNTLHTHGVFALGDMIFVNKHLATVNNNHGWTKTPKKPKTQTNGPADMLATNRRGGMWQFVPYHAGEQWNTSVYGPRPTAQQLVAASTNRIPGSRNHHYRVVAVAA